MNNRPAASFDGVLERTADGGVIRFERHLPYAAEDVWDAITNPSRLAQWWLPSDAHITLDLQAGGSMVITPHEGGSAPTVCPVLRVEPPRLFEHVHLDGVSHMRWELESVDSGCVLRLSHFVTDTTRAIRHSYLAGLHTSLARLEPCLAGRPVAWDWDDFTDAQVRYAEAPTDQTDNRAEEQQR